MAGFLDSIDNIHNSQTWVSEQIKKLSRIGFKYDSKVLKNSRAIGIAEDEFGQQNQFNSNSEDIWKTFASLSLTDTSAKKNIAFFDKQYKTRRENLREIALQDEIEDILDILSDEAIVYDVKNFFCKSEYLSGGIKDDVRDKLSTNFKKIYNYFNFNDGISAWNYFRKWLIDGFLAFEIIYSDDQKEIIGFKELDPITLVPGVDPKTNKKIYIQNNGEGNKERTLYDANIIYISYSSINSPSRFSYIERLVRSFNILRVMEHTRIIWAVTNSSFKTKFVIPVGGKSKTRAKQSLSQLMHNYREQVDFNYESGEIVTNGKPMMPFNKEYWLPSKDGDTPEIDVIGGEGPELSDTDTLKYFSDKLKMVSKIPYSRFDQDSPAGFEIAAEGMMRDEIRFSKFINRIRSIFQEILVKPLYIQMILDYPGLIDDTNFKGNISIKYNKENVFEEMKNFELTQKRLDHIQSLRDNLTETNSDGDDIPFFDLEFLINKYGNFDEDDLKSNEKYKLIKSIIKEGYDKNDAIKIANGEDKSKFKPKPTDDDM